MGADDSGPACRRREESIVLRSVSLLLLTALAFQAQAKVDASQAARLGQELTPLGGERAGNASGTIPAWTGGLATPPANYQPGMHHPDPYADDKLLYRVDSQNLAQYEQQLPHACIVAEGP